MRTFSNTEKEIINFLITEYQKDNKAVLFQKIAINLIERNNGNIKYLSGEILENLWFYKESEDSKSFYSLFVEFIFLIESLHSEHYISILLSGLHSLPEGDLYIPYEKEGSFETKILDKDFLELIKKYHGAQIFPSQILINLFKNDYFSQEQINHNQIIHNSRTSIYIAISIGLISLIIGIFGLFKKNSSEINQEQIEKLINEFSIIESKLDTLNVNILNLGNDTLQLNIK